MVSEDASIYDEVCEAFGYAVERDHAGIVEPEAGHRFAALIDPANPYAAKFTEIGPAIDQDGVVHLPAGIGKCYLGKGTTVHAFREAKNTHGRRGTALCSLSAFPLKRTTDEINCHRCLTKLSRM